MKKNVKELILLFKELFDKDSYEENDKKKFVRLLLNKFRIIGFNLSNEFHYKKATELIDYFIKKCFFYGMAEEFYNFGFDLNNQKHLKKVIEICSNYIKFDQKEYFLADLLESMQSNEENWRNKYTGHYKNLTYFLKLFGLDLKEHKDVLGPVINLIKKRLLDKNSENFLKYVKYGSSVTEESLRFAVDLIESKLEHIKERKLSKEEKKVINKIRDIRGAYLMKLFRKRFSLYGKVSDLDKENLRKDFKKFVSEYPYKALTNIEIFQKTDNDYRKQIAEICYDYGYNDFQYCSCDGYHGSFYTYIFKYFKKFDLILPETKEFRKSLAEKFINKNNIHCDWDDATKSRHMFEILESFGLLDYDNINYIMKNFEIIYSDKNYCSYLRRLFTYSFISLKKEKYKGLTFKEIVFFKNGYYVGSRKAELRKRIIADFIEMYKVDLDYCKYNILHYENGYLGLLEKVELTNIGRNISNTKWVSIMDKELEQYCDTKFMNFILKYIVNSANLTKAQLDKIYTLIENENWRYEDVKERFRKVYVFYNIQNRAHDEDTNNIWVMIKKMNEIILREENHKKISDLLKYLVFGRFAKAVFSDSREDFFKFLKDKILKKRRDCMRGFFPSFMVDLSIKDIILNQNDFLRRTNKCYESGISNLLKKDVLNEEDVDDSLKYFLKTIALMKELKKDYDYIDDSWMEDAVKLQKRLEKIESEEKKRIAKMKKDLEKEIKVQAVAA